MRLHHRLFWLWRQNKESYLESLLLVLSLALGLAIFIVIGSYNFETDIKKQEEDKICSMNIRLMMGLTSADFVVEGEARFHLPYDAELSQIRSHLFFSDYLQLKEGLKDKAYVYLISNVNYININSNENNISFVTDDFFPAKDFSIAEGELFSSEDILDCQKVCILGASIAEVLFPDTDPLGQLYDYSFGRFDPVKIIGVLEPIAKEYEFENAIYSDRKDSYNYKVFLPYSRGNNFAKEGPMRKTSDPEIMERLRSGGRVMLNTYIFSIDTNPTIYEMKLVSFPDLNQLEYIKEEVRNSLGADLRKRLVFNSVVGNRELAAGLSKMQMAFVLITSLALIVAALNVMNLLLARLVRREKGIALFMALGARRNSAVKQYIVEGFLLTGLGIIFGLILTKLWLALTIKFSQDWRLDVFVIQPRIICWGIIIALALNGLFSIYPIWELLKRRPADSLQGN